MRRPRKTHAVWSRAVVLRVLLGFALVLATAAPVAAVRKLTPKFAVSAVAPVETGADAAIRWSVSRSVRTNEIVYLEQAVGRTWVRKSAWKVHPNHSGRMVVRQPVGGTYRYRIWVKATAKHKTAVSPAINIKVVGLPLPSITAQGPGRAGTGVPTTITSKVAYASTGGEILLLELYSRGAWRAMGSAALASNGSAAIALTQPTAGTYGYRLRLAATTRHKAATSRTYPITVSGTTRSAARAAASAGGLCGGGDLRRPDGTSWVCTYADEFKGTTLDRRYWVPQVSSTSKFFTGTKESPACVTDRPDTVSVSNGRLDLSARLLEEPIGCGTKSSAQVSGMVMHHRTFAQTYGRYEIRAKVPSWDGKGLQETFWLWPVDVHKYGDKHPSSGEIDIAEFYSNYVDLNIPVTHYLLDRSTVDDAAQKNVYTAYDCKIVVGEYNTYTLEWLPGRLTILVNGETCLVNNYAAQNATAANPYAPFDSPFFLALTQAFGTTGNEFDPATGPTSSATSVDYVRIWS